MKIRRWLRLYFYPEPSATVAKRVGQLLQVADLLRGGQV